MVAWFNVNSTDGFMFAGHRQVNVTLLSFSQIELTFNLYPLKSNFQRLPDLKLELVNTQDDSALKENLIETSLKPESSHRQTELNELLKRWLPKSVFVHVSFSFDCFRFAKLNHFSFHISQPPSRKLA
jgi:trafficking protein particle complex subunit 11